MSRAALTIDARKFVAALLPRLAPKTRADLLADVRAGRCAFDPDEAGAWGPSGQATVL